MSLFDPLLFDDELFDVEDSTSAPTLPFTVSGLILLEPIRRIPFTETLVAYVHVRRLERFDLLGETIIRRHIDAGMVASVEAIQRFTENMTLDSFILPSDLPTEMWSRIPAETWENLLEKKQS